MFFEYFLNFYIFAIYVYWRLTSEIVNIGIQASKITYNNINIFKIFMF